MVSVGRIGLITPDLNYHTRLGGIRQATETRFRRGGG